MARRRQCQRRRGDSHHEDDDTFGHVGPFDLREIALMGFGHRDERSSTASCNGILPGRRLRAAGRRCGAAVGRPAGVAGRGHRRSAERHRSRGCAQAGCRGGLTRPRRRGISPPCLADPVLSRVHARAPGFRPALFYSPYEAAVWSIISARRARSQAITLRIRMSEQYGACFELSGSSTTCVPTPSSVLQIESLPGLPADRIPRLHAVAEAAQRGQLDAQHLRAMPPEDARAELQQLPGIGPFYSSLIVIRACGHSDAPSLGEPRSRAAIQAAYGIDHEQSDAELLALADTWRPFRTWVSVMMRAFAV